MGSMEPKSISHEPLVVKTWQTPHFNQKHVSMTVAYSSYTSQMTGTVQKCPNKVKRDQQASKGTKRCQKGPRGVQLNRNLYLTNLRSQKLDGRPLILSRKVMFLLVYHIFHTFQMTGSAQKCPNKVKRGQKGSKSISRELLILDTRQTPQFNQNNHVSISVSNILYLSDKRKYAKMPK